jgi:hypothetical protein
MNTIKIHRKISSPQLRISQLKEFIGKNVEITISETSIKKQAQLKAVGILSAFSNKSKLSNEKQAWIIAARKKHENS